MPLFLSINNLMEIDNFNGLQPNGFRITITREYQSHLQYFAQSIQHPSVELSPVELGFKRVSNIPFAGNQIENGSVTLDILADENFESYKEMYDWMLRTINEEHTPQSKKFSREGSVPTTYHDLTVTILTSSNNANFSILYKNALPIGLGDVQFASTSDGEYITFPATFRFDYFEIK